MTGKLTVDVAMTDQWHAEITVFEKPDGVLSKRR